MSLDSRPQEYDGLNHRSPENTAYLRLWASACALGLEDAAKEFGQFMSQKHPKTSPKYRPMESYPALDWLYNDANIGVGSFLWCCEVFDINPKKARGAWRSRARSIAARKTWGGNAIEIEEDTQDECK